MRILLVVMGVFAIAAPARAQECPSGAVPLSYQLVGHRVVDEQLAFAGGSYLALWENPEPTIAAVAGDGTLGMVGPLTYPIGGATTWRLTGGATTFLLTSRMPDGVNVQLLGPGGTAIGAQRRVAAQGDVSAFAAAFDGARYDVVWSDAPDGAVFLVRVDEAGTVLDAAPIQIAAATAGGRAAVPHGPLASARAGAVTWVVFVETDATQSIEVVGVRVSDAGVVLDATPIALASFPAGSFPLPIQIDGVPDRLALASLGDQAMLAWLGPGDRPPALVLPLGPDGPLAASPVTIDPQPGAGLRVAAIQALPGSDGYALYLGTDSAVLDWLGGTPDRAQPGAFAGYAITRAGALASTTPVLQASGASVSVAPAGAGVALGAVDEPAVGQSRLVVQRYAAGGALLGAATTVSDDRYTLAPQCVCMTPCDPGDGASKGGGCAVGGGGGGLALALALLVTGRAARSRRR